MPRQGSRRIRAVVRGVASPFNGVLKPPGDKSISHRALIFASMCEGVSKLSGLSFGQDVVATYNVLSKLGVNVSRDSVDHTLLTVHGEGPWSYKEPSDILEVENSGTLLRLMTGVLSGTNGHFVLTGDSSIVKRPMLRVVAPLREMGARIDGRQDGALAPISIRGSRLKGTKLDTKVPSAQVKSALLLAGLFAEGSTHVRERVRTRSHTEEFLAYLDIDHRSENQGGGREVVVHGLTSAPKPFNLSIPADPSQAAFFIGGALIAPGSEVTFKNLYLGEGRDAYLSVLRRMGANLDESRHVSDVFSSGDLKVSYSNLVATEIHQGEVPALIDEVPILATVACFAEGKTVFHGIEELRTKESDRVVTTTEMLRRFGARVESDDSTLTVYGDTTFSPKPCNVQSHGDHRIAMCAAIMATRVNGDTEIEDFNCVETSYNNFLGDLTRLWHGETFIA